MNRHRQIRKYVQIVNIYQNYGSTSIPFFLVYVLTPITKMENVTNICDPFASLGSTREWRRVVTDQTRTADLVCVCVCHSPVSAVYALTPITTMENMTNLCLPWFGNTITQKRRQPESLKTQYYYGSVYLHLCSKC